MGTRYNIENIFHLNWDSLIADGRAAWWFADAVIVIGDRRFIESSSGVCDVFTGEIVARMFIRRYTGKYCGVLIIGHDHISWVTKNGHIEPPVKLDIPAGSCISFDAVPGDLDKCFCQTTKYNCEIRNRDRGGSLPITHKCRCYEKYKLGDGDYIIVREGVIRRNRLLQFPPNSIEGWTWRGDNFVVFGKIGVYDVTDDVLLAASGANDVIFGLNNNVVLFRRKINNKYGYAWYTGRLVERALKRGECASCYIRSEKRVAYNCGHSVLCPTCDKKFADNGRSNCSVCGVEITTRMEIFS
jgi:hypothetical protein